MAAPFLVWASIGNTDTSGAWTSPTLVADVIGDIVIYQVLQDGATSGAISSTVTTQGTGAIDALDGTTGTMTYIGQFAVGSATVAYQHLWIGRISATGTVTVAGTNSTSEDVYMRLYEFGDVSAGKTLATVIENVTAGSTVTGAATSGTIADASVQTLGPDRLPLNFVGINDDNAIAAFTGMTGGTWAEGVAEYAESGGTDGCIQLQLGLAAQSPNYTAGLANFIWGGVAGTNEKMAQSFVAGSTGIVSSYQVRLSKVVSPADNVVIELCEDAAGVPGTVLATNSVVGSSLISSVGSGGFVNSSGGGAILTSGTTYWVVVRRDGAFDAANKYEIFGTTAGSQYTGTLYHYDSSWVAYAATDEANLQINMRFVNGTLDGGTATNSDATDGWGVVGFALIGTTQVSKEIRKARYVDRD